MIRIVLYDYAKRNNYVYCKDDVDTMIAEDPDAGTCLTNFNFEPIGVDDPALTVIKELYQSLRRLRKDTKSIDDVSKKMKDISDRM